jgi:glycosyltransferase involved in cell wall biosynthesis
MYSNYTLQSVVLTNREIGLLSLFRHTIYTFMKILIATGLSSPDIGGPATYTKFLERHLPLQHVEYVVVSFRDVRMYPKVIRHGVYFARLLWHGRKANILYALDTVSVGVPTLLASYCLRKKLFLRVPGDYAWEQGQQRFDITATLDEYLTLKEKPFFVRVLSWLQLRVAKHATKIVVPSDYMKNVVALWGVSPHKIIRIYSALNPIHIQEEREVLRARFRYDGFVVTTSARLVPWKGIEALITSIHHLKEQGVDVELHIIGEGSERIHLEEADQYIHVWGAVSKEELSLRIASSDAFVLNTSYEGLSHQLLEVMDIGIPIITTGVGGNVELVSHKKEALIVPFNDVSAIESALMELRANPELCQTMVQNAREKVKLFREDVIIPEIGKLFV